MKRTVYFNDFERAFKGEVGSDYATNFSFNGKRALFDYLLELEDDTGEEMELDIVALCCEYEEDSISYLILFESELTIDTLCFWRRFRKEEEEDDDEVEVDIAPQPAKLSETETSSGKEKIEPVIAKAPEKKVENKEDEMDIAMRNSAGREYTPPPLSLLANDSGKPGTLG